MQVRSPAVAGDANRHLERLAVTIRSVEADYGDAPVLRGIDLDVVPGEVLALLGPSGCGKTTLLRCIAGLEPVRAGSIEIGDQLVSRPGRLVAPERRRVGMVFQDGGLFPHLSVAANVGYGLPRAQRRGPVVDDLLSLVGMVELGDRAPGTLSGGQQQRVALARALASSPGVLLLDEPFSSLDAALRVSVRTEVDRLLEEIGVTSILVTHDQDEALMMGDRVAVMRDGLVEQVGTPAEVYVSPATPWVAQFVGEASLLAGHAHGGVATTAIGRVDVGGSPDGDVRVLYRPEQLVVETGVGSQIERIEYSGQQSRYEVRLASGELAVVRATGVPIHLSGDEVAVRFTGTTTRAWPATG